ncbi:hypothetical protein GCM10027612_55400 [Microbispora bryophytorum subsp. camponoti]
MDIFWFLTFAVLLAGYFALEGFDIGLGALLPVLGRSPPTATASSARWRRSCSPTRCGWSRSPVCCSARSRCWTAGR